MTPARHEVDREIPSLRYRCVAAILIVTPATVTARERVIMYIPARGTRTGRAVDVLQTGPSAPYVYTCTAPNEEPSLLAAVGSALSGYS